ncbi:MAG: hypothetical protein SPG61_07440, partial [Arcanobacterium sp.]|nr:hypothetical protein [Arcanobacterium sp.]
MSIELSVSSAAVNDPEFIDFDDPNLLPDSQIIAPIGFDLTALGAHPTEIPGEYGPESAIAALNYPRFVASVQAALHGDVDFIYLDHDFHTQAERITKTSTLDAVRVVEKLSTVIDQGGICAEVPFDTVQGLPSLEGLLANFSGMKTVSLELGLSPDLELLAEFGAVARKNELKLFLLVDDVALVSQYAAELVAASDAVVLRIKEQAQARKARFILREQATKLAKEFHVYIAFGIVISATLQAAEERAMLLSQLGDKPLFSHLPYAVGTVYDISDAIESWIGTGA